jgi:hypothetical protein
MKALFISTTDLKKDSVFNQNIDDAFIKDLIYLAQRMYILPLLGSKLYEEIQTQIENDNVSVANAYLLDEYIVPALTLYTRADAYIDLNYRLTNKAVNTNSSTFSQPVSFQDAKDLSERFLNKAEFFGQQLKKYLCFNTATYPLYLQNVDEDLKPLKTAYDCGIYLGPTTGCCDENKGKYE